MYLSREPAGISANFSSGSGGISLSIWAAPGLAIASSALATTKVLTKVVIHGPSRSLGGAIAGRDVRSPLGQLELDAAVAAIGVLGRGGLERLELAEAGGDQALRRHAPADQVL